MSEELTAWPYQEAREILEHLDRIDSEKGDKPVLFETGFGPSGLPHIGTFSEVARTAWVQRAFSKLSDRPTRLVAFSDDMDGLRKVPQNMPNPDMLAKHLGKPLCDIPDPYGEEESFSGYMNAKLRSFLDSFEFDYEFVSSQEQYRSGVFNKGLLRILECYDEVRNVIIPTLRNPNRDEWSPFFAVCENCGKVNNTRVTDVHPEDGTLSYVCDQSFRGADACGHESTVAVTDGNVKVGWKVDWAMRWYVLGVDYEMYGKDLIDSAELSSEIVKILGGEPPAGMFYEHFLDENGAKISKSKGTGLTIDEWLQYGTLESLAWYIYRKPGKAKRLFFETIPRSTDQYLEALTKFGRSEDETEKLDSPVQFIEADRIDAGEDVSYQCEISYSMILNLVNVLNTDDREIVWDYLRRYDESVDNDARILNDLIDRALRYYRDFVLPTKEFELPDEEVMVGVRQLREFLASYQGNDPEQLQSATYQAGKDNGIKLGKWFKSMYRMLLGQDQGPRLGTFIHLYGVSETLALIDERIAQAESGELDG